MCKELVQSRNHVQFFCDPMYSSLPGSSVHGDSPGKNIGLSCQSLEGWDGVGGRREVQEGGDMCIPMANSC